MPSENRILTKMLDRLFAALVNGPSLNCRPHSSRQRVDWTHLGRLKDASPEDALRTLLGDSCKVSLTARAKAPRRGAEERADEDLSPEDRAARTAWADQTALLGKLRGIAEDARTYEQDTGVHVLNIGFPLLSLPPGAAPGKGRGAASRRVVAPVAFVPVSITIKSGATPGVVIGCKGEGVDRVTPNTALLAWLEQQTGKELDENLFEDEAGRDPWREIGELVRRVCGALEIPVPEMFEEKREGGAGTAEASDPAEVVAESNEPSAPADESPLAASHAPIAEQVQDDADDDDGAELPILPVATSEDNDDEGEEEPEQDNAADAEDAFKLAPAPRADDAPDQPTITPSAVLGLFPMANQGLLRDMQAMAAGESLAGPVTSFVRADLSLDATPEPAGPDAPAQPVARKTRVFAEERLVARADPCQARAVKLAREARGLVIHGPPGTGKSQTITNIVGDHLSRGDRVLLVSDKRTALDVVANRLEHMGLGKLVALIHDPQRDQRDLYRAIREQLETLAETQTNERAEKQLAKVDVELQELHAELTGYWEALHAGFGASSDDPDRTRKDADAESFHTLVGKWLAIADTPESAKLEPLGKSIALDDLDQHAHLIDETLGRVAKVEWWHNPWRDAAGIELAALLAVPTDKWRDAMRGTVDVAAAADATADAAIPPFEPALDLKGQADARAALAERLAHALEHVSAEVRGRWVDKDDATLSRVRMRLSEIDPQLQALRRTPLDAELAMTARERMPSMSDIALHLGALEQYLPVASKWYGFLMFSAKGAVRAALAQYGLGLSAANAERLKAFLTGLRSRMVLQALHYELYQLPAGPGLLGDDVLEKTLGEHREVIELLAHVRGTSAVAPLLPRVVATLKDAAGAGPLLHGLRASPTRAAAVLKLLDALAGTRLIAKEWLAGLDASLRAGGVARETVEALANRVGDVESVLRVRAALAKLPAGVRDAIAKLAAAPVEPNVAVGATRRVALAAEIARRLAGDPRLQNVDGERVSSAFERYRKLEAKKRDLVREVIVHQWTSRQKERLLSSTGTRLGPLGAELKRRLTMRGERAMRLRQVLAAGRRTEGGDPLFDVCPVWMASPETVAQLFARREEFAVIIFDEASQCRLEETLPVLTRGRRVVIAGDPKQLPPTRFFESAVAQSDDADEVETDQQLFEAQQGEIEDLLGAALNLEIEQCYLDVHYRSRSSELIEFSNEHFYGSRLQAIPGHPGNRPDGPPLVLHRADGVYEKQENPAEADKIVEIVAELLKRKDPPSIGIACFNLQQRDLIVEKLDERAVEDERFGRRLAEARTRQGAGSFEGLFVKNLENVQGDERDHMIISTTYGPDKTARFYRRFGPLGRAGGGRRLNVLVTRAREAVHLVTSIPAEAYRALPPVPAGQAPTGGWLLFAYLKYAEEVGRAYVREGEAPSEPRVTPSPDGGEAASAAGSSGAREAFVVRKLPTKTPSVLAESLAAKLAAEHAVGSDVYWGNDGFLVDLALRDPADAGAVTVGVLCDASRFAGAADPVEWDVFRTGVHEAQGWTLARVWSPQVFRDPKGVVEGLTRRA